MDYSPTDLLYSLRQSSLLAVVKSLLKLLNSITDTRVALISSSDSDLNVLNFRSDIQLNCCCHEEGLSSSNTYLQLKTPINSENNFCRDLHSPQLQDEFCCSLNLLDLLPTKTLSSEPKPSVVMILGLGDRFNIFLQAINIGTKAGEKLYELNCIFDLSILTDTYAKIQRQLRSNHEISVGLDQAIDTWAAQPNAPTLQTQFTLQLITALENNHTVGTHMNVPPIITTPTKTEFLQTEKLLEELLPLNQSTLGASVILQRAVNVIQETFGVSRCLIAFYPQADLVGSGIEKIKSHQYNGADSGSSNINIKSGAQENNLTGLEPKIVSSQNGASQENSNRIISYVSGNNQASNATWGASKIGGMRYAIAHAPEIAIHDRQLHFPEREVVEQRIFQNHQTSPWTTEPYLWGQLVQPRISSHFAQSAFLTWLHPTSQPSKLETNQNSMPICGLLMVEQWQGDRIWQPEEMQLLHLALHQVHLAIEQANLYQQAEERANHAALLNRLVGHIRASLELSHIFETVTIELGHLLVADRCSIVQYLEDQKVWKALTEYRAHPDIPAANHLIISDQNNPYSSALRNLQIVEVSDTRTVSDPVNRAQAAKYPGSWLMVPIHRQQKLWGCLIFTQHEYPRFWHDSELRLLTTVADQLAIAIHQATLYQQIQQQNQTLEALVLSRTAELESFFDAHPDYIFVVERQDLRLRFCNQAFAQGMGFDNRFAIQGCSILECFPPLVANSFARQNLRLFELGETLHEQETLVLADGIHHFDTFRVPLKHPNGEVYACLGTSRDITELVETKQALSERTEQLQDALSAARAASQAKTEFLATMSHELRTPLTAVIGMSSALLQRYLGELNTKQTEYLKIIHNSGEHLLNLINDILDLSKIEAGKATLKISEFSLREVVRASLCLVRERAQGQQVKLITQLDELPECDNFHGDERRMKQILLNLLSNAVKFTHSGGQVYLKMKYENKTVIIEVADTGIGIPSEKHHLVFEAFQQIDSSLHRKHEGTGLGLALTRQLVEMHGGTIEFQSTVDVGTVFTVYLQDQQPSRDTAVLTERNGSSSGGHK